MILQFQKVKEVNNKYIRMTRSRDSTDHIQN